MENLKEYIVKKKYDLLLVVCLILMVFVNVLFALPGIVFLMIGESKKDI